MSRVDDLYALAPIGMVVGALVGLILWEPDVGTSMTLLVIAVAMVFAAGLSYKYVITAILCGLPIAYFILMAAPYRRRRLMAFWDPWSDPLGDGFQVIQSLIAVGSGGLIGRGFRPALRAVIWSPAYLRANPSAIWLRAELPLQRKRTVSFDMLVPRLYSARRIYQAKKNQSQQLLPCQRSRSASLANCGSS